MLAAEPGPAAFTPPGGTRDEHGHGPGGTEIKPPHAVRGPGTAVDSQLPPFGGRLRQGRSRPPDERVAAARPRRQVQPRWRRRAVARERGEPIQPPVGVRRPQPGGRGTRRRRKRQHRNDHRDEKRNHEHASRSDHGESPMKGAAARGQRLRDPEPYAGRTEGGRPSPVPRPLQRRAEWNATGPRRRGLGRASRAPLPATAW